MPIRWQSLVVLISALLAASFGAQASTKLVGTVYYSDYKGEYTFKSGVQDSEHGVAWGVFKNEAHKDGWDKLWVYTSPNYPSNIQTYAAGYLEGALTTTQIYQYFLNMNAFFLTDNNYTAPLLSELAQFVSTQIAWAQDQVTKYANSTHDTALYWSAVGDVLAQFQGLQDGYNALCASSEQLDVLQFMMLTGGGDLPDIANALNYQRNPPKPLAEGEFPFSPEEVWAIFMRGRCSSLVKVNGDLSDVFAGHTTWWTYYSMNRIYKHYNFAIPTPYSATYNVSFSSYPGSLVSIDDFYITNQQLVIMETTNSNFNTSLYLLIQPHSLLSWQRTMVANRLATSGDDWTNVFSKFNSGTYNNQWIVLDAKKIETQNKLNNGTLWILEQCPGLIQRADVTPILERGYWASYNVPYFTEMSNMMGYPAAIPTWSAMLSYQHAVRANIFRRDQGSVATFNDFKKLMRYNDWENDPYSLGNPAYAISSRFDMTPDAKIRGPFGGTDTKATSLLLLQDMACEAESGPTHDQQPVFDWSTAPLKASHIGQPNKFDFGFVTMVQSPDN